MVSEVEQQSASARAAVGGEDLGNSVARSVTLSSPAVSLADGLALPGVPVEGPGGWHEQAWSLEFFSRLDEGMTTGPVPLAEIADDAWRIVEGRWP